MKYRGRSFWAVASIFISFVFTYLRTGELAELWSCVFFFCKLWIFFACVFLTNPHRQNACNVPHQLCFPVYQNGSYNDDRNSCYKLRIRIWSSAILHFMTSYYVFTLCIFFEQCLEWIDTVPTICINSKSVSELDSNKIDTDNY